MILLIYKRDIKAKITRNDVRHDVSKDVYFKIQVSFAFVSYSLVELSCDSIHLSTCAWKLFYFAVTWILCSQEQLTSQGISHRSVFATLFLNVCIYHSYDIQLE